MSSKAKVIDVLDKGAGALLIAGSKFNNAVIIKANFFQPFLVETFDESGKPLFYNQVATFFVGAGGFGGPRTSNNSEVRNITNVPKRSPDAVDAESTSKSQVRYLF